MKTIIIYLCLIVISFWLGMKYFEFQYNDICLDMGGGKNPDNYQICVVEVKK